MNPPRPARLILTHLAIVLAGALLGALALPRPPSDAAESTATSGPPGATPRPGRTSPPATFRQAWQELLHRPLARATRLRCQSQLLTAWAEVDLEGALQAALAEPWETPHYGRSDPLYSPFETAFTRHPLKAWRILQSGRLGSGAQILREGWIRVVAASDPSLVISMLDEIPRSLERQSLEAAFEEKEYPWASGKEIQRQRLMKLAGEAAPEDAARRIGIAVKTISLNGKPDLLRAQWLAQPDDVAGRVALALWAKSATANREEDFNDQWAEVPAEFRTQAIAALLAQTGGQTGNTSKALIYRRLVDRAIEAGLWTLLAEPRSFSISYPLSEATGSYPWRKEAAWVSTLPARPELTAIAGAAMKNFLTHDPRSTRSWLGQLPAGWLRDCGMLQSTLFLLAEIRPDEPAARAAAAGIADPALRHEALLLLTDWGMRHGR